MVQRSSSKIISELVLTTDRFSKGTPKQIPVAVPCHSDLLPSTPPDGFTWQDTYSPFVEHDLTCAGTKKTETTAATSQATWQVLVKLSSDGKVSVRIKPKYEGNKVLTGLEP